MKLIGGLATANLTEFAFSDDGVDLNSVDSNSVDSNSVDSNSVDSNSVDLRDSRA